MPGHVFVTRGDLTKLACDAWLLPGSQSPRGPRVSRKWFDNADWLRAVFDDRVLVDAVPVKGAKRVWRLPETTPDPGRIFLAHTGGNENRKVSWYMEAVDEFLDAVRQSDPGQERTRRDRPLIGLPLVGTGKGGQSRRRGPMVRALLNRLYEAAADNTFSADYVLVALRDGDYAAAQAERRGHPDKRAWAALPDPDLIALATHLAGLAASGQLVLFLGAGVSAGAGLPMWRELLKRLATKKASLSEREADDLLRRLDPLDAARIIQRRMDSAGLEIGPAIREELAGDRHSLSHALLASLPVREVATTNYDELL